MSGRESEGCDMPGCVAVASVNVMAVHRTNPLLPAVLAVCDKHSAAFRVGQRFELSGDQIRVGVVAKMAGHYMVQSIVAIEG